MHGQHAALIFELFMLFSQLQVFYICNRARCHYKEQIAGHVAITTYTHACMDQYDVFDPSVAIAMHACMHVY